MSLAVPDNIVGQLNAVEILETLLRNELRLYVDDGQAVNRLIQPDEYQSIVVEILKCKFVIILQGSRGPNDPIAAFIGNDSLRQIKLLYFLGHQSKAKKHKNAEPFPISHWNVDTLGAYIRILLRDHDWLDVVTAPIDLSRLNGMLGMVVEYDGTSKISLAEAGHRPKSSREIT